MSYQIQERFVTKSCDCGGQHHWVDPSEVGRATHGVCKLHRIYWKLTGADLVKACGPVMQSRALTREITNKVMQSITVKRVRPAARPVARAVSRPAPSQRKVHTWSSEEGRAILAKKFGTVASKAIYK